MHTGLLWFDDSPSRTLEEKIARATTRYREKYGAQPNICYIHPDNFGEVASIKTEARSTVLRHHFWIGQEDES